MLRGVCFERAVFGFMLLGTERADRSWRGAGGGVMAQFRTFAATEDVEVVLGGTRASSDSDGVAVPDDFVSNIRRHLDNGASKILRSIGEDHLEGAVGGSDAVRQPRVASKDFLSQTRVERNVAGDVGDPHFRQEKRSPPRVESQV